MTPEAKVKKKVVETLKQLGVYHFFASTHGFGSSGVPDIIVCAAGYFLGLEVKAGKNKPTALQEKNLRDIKANGGLALVVNEDNVEQLRDIIIQFVKERS